MSLAGRTLAEAIVNSSALMCILLDEPAAPFFFGRPSDSGSPIDYFLTPLTISTGDGVKQFGCQFNGHGVAIARTVQANNRDSVVNVQFNGGVVQGWIQ